MNGKHSHRVAALAITLTLGASIACFAPARAVTDADIRAGVFSDEAGIGVGAGLLTDIGQSRQWYFNPNLEAARGDRRDQLAMNADFHYDFRSDSPVSAYLGGGPALLWRQWDGRDGETEPGMNLLGGVVRKRGEVRPFVQMKGVVADRSQVALVGGIRF